MCASVSVSVSVCVCVCVWLSEGLNQTLYHTLDAPIPACEHTLTVLATPAETWTETLRANLAAEVIPDLPVLASVSESAALAVAVAVLLAGLARVSTHDAMMSHAWAAATAESLWLTQDPGRSKLTWWIGFLDSYHQ